MRQCKFTPAIPHDFPECLQHSEPLRRFCEHSALLPVLPTATDSWQNMLGTSRMKITAKSWFYFDKQVKYSAPLGQSCEHSVLHPVLPTTSDYKQKPILLLQTFRNKEVYNSPCNTSRFSKLCAAYETCGAPLRT